MSTMGWKPAGASAGVDDRAETLAALRHLVGHVGLAAGCASCGRGARLRADFLADAPADGAGDRPAARAGDQVAAAGTG
jgi:hypothetical protein